MKTLNQIFKSSTTAMAISLFLIGCAQSHSPEMTAFQANSQKVLQHFATNVSRGIAGVSGSASRGVTSNYNYTYGNFSVPTSVNSTLLSSAMEDELNACTDLVNAVPPTGCDNYNFMISSLSRCLDRIITYRNPLLTYAFKNLDNRGQQYWSYLLNSRQPQTFNMFVGSQAYGPNANFASSGQLPTQSYTGSW